MKIYRLLVASLALVVLGGPAIAQERTSVRDVATITGTVDRIDRGTRTLVLRVSPDTTRQLEVPAGMKIFDELKAGDTITARVRESVIVTTKPGLKPELVTDTTATAPRAPGSNVVQQLRTVVTIVEVDPKLALVTYRTADNRRAVRGVTDPALLAGLKPGDVVEITLTREQVVELERRR